VSVPMRTFLDVGHSPGLNVILRHSIYIAH
jgi:hypothetical protein